jgi:pyrrolysine biosynthesis protein PylD
MTRLKEDDIESIMQRINDYNEELIKNTGHTLSDIVAHAVGMCSRSICDPGLIAVLPMTSGQGIIGGFSETVAGILNFLGMNTFVPSSPDANGFAEALERRAEIVFMADDHRFIAAHLKTGRFSDNSVATGRGYVAALDYLTGGLKERKVLILGAGSVGRAAAFSILDFGGTISIYDKNPSASERLEQDVFSQRGQYVTIEKDLDSALLSHRAIIVACPEGGFIRREHLFPDSFIAAPGVPLGIHPEAIDLIRPRLVHDPLQLGVATMLYEVLKEIE